MKKVSHTGKVKIAELVLDDFDLYPRSSVDSYQIRSLADAIVAGADLPPIVVWKKTMQVIDGLHRCKAKLLVEGDGAEIEVVFFEYTDKKEAFLHAVELNSAHGVRLDTHDKIHCALIARRLGIAEKEIANRIRMTLARYKEIVEKRLAEERSSGSPIPLKQTIEHMAGRRLTKKQEEVNEKLGGMRQKFYVNQLILLLEEDMIDWENEGLVEALAKLNGLLNRNLKGRRNTAESA